MNLSVIIPVFNDEKNIVRAVNSILKQTLSAYEIIIVDDCSSDSTPLLIQDLCKTHPSIKVYKTNSNSGSCTVPLNIALSEATGDIIVRMDSDDYSYPTRFASQVEFLKKNPDVHIVGTSVRLNDSGGKGGVYKPPLSYQEVKDYKYTKTLVVHPSAMIRRDLFDKIGFYSEDHFRCEDMELWFRCLNSGFKISNLKEVQLDYTSVKRSVRFKEAFNVVRLILTDSNNTNRLFDGVIGIVKYLLSFILKWLTR